MRIYVPTVLATPFEALALAIDKNETEEAKAILDAILQNHCEWPAPEPQESTFTLSAPTLPVRAVDPYDLRLEDDDDPIPDTVLARVFQPEPCDTDTESDRQLLEQALAQNSDTSPVEPVVETADLTATVALTAPVEPRDAPTDGTASTVSDDDSALLTSAPAPVELPADQNLDHTSAAPAPTSNPDTIADLLQLAEVYSRVAPLDPVEARPETSLATEGGAAVELAGDVEPIATAAVMVEDPAALTAATAAVAAPSEVAPIEAVETVTETTEKVAVETPDLEPVTLQTDPVSAVETDLETAPETTTIDATPNADETVENASTPMQLEAVAEFWQKPESVTVDPSELDSTPVLDTTTVENVEAPTADTTSLCPELSTPTEALLPKLELVPEVEPAIIETESEAESFSHACVEPEPSLWVAHVESENSHHELTQEAVTVTAAALEAPVESDQTDNIQAPLSYGADSELTSMELRLKHETADTISGANSPNESVEQALKTPEAAALSELAIPVQNTLDILDSNFTTLVEPPIAPQVLEAVVEAAPLTVEQVAVTPTTPLPEPPVPVDMVRELATFAVALFQTWQRLTLTKRGELSLCWGLSVSFDYLYREGFSHLTAYRFFVLLGTLLQSETDSDYGCLQVLHQGKAEPVELNGQPFNCLTFYAPGTPKHEQKPAALKQAQATIALLPTAQSAQELERIRQERDAHLAIVQQDKEQQQGRQSRKQKPEGLLGTLRQYFVSKQKGPGSQP